MIEVIGDDNTLCAACAMFGASCLMPAEAVGREGAPLPVCWLCAHLITEHGATLETAGDKQYDHCCECDETIVYPARASDPTAEGN